jgi:hypothetical protein
MEKELIIKNKIYFKEKLYYVQNIPLNTQVMVAIGQRITANQEIARSPEPSEYIRVEYSGRPKVKQGDKVLKGDILSQAGTFRKTKVYSPQEAEVIEINEDSILLKNNADFETVAVSVKSSVSGIVEKITTGKIIISYSGVVLNLLDSKGEGKTGKLRYISSMDFENKKNLPSNLENVIVVMDYLIPEAYPILSTLGAVGVISNSIDYMIYSEMIILAVPIGLITGFGRHKEDLKLKKFFLDQEDSLAWFDSDNSKLIIPMDKSPSWLKSYEFKFNL